MRRDEVTWTGVLESDIQARRLGLRWRREIHTPIFVINWSEAHRERNLDVNAVLMVPPSVSMKSFVSGFARQLLPLIPIPSSFKMIATSHPSVTVSSVKRFNRLSRD